MRKLHDKYFKQAKREGHLARSIYKLEELDRRNRLLRRGDRVLDLGAAPGSWLEHILPAVGEEGTVCAVDLQPIAKRLRSRVTFLARDVRDLRAEDFAGVAERFDAVLSDMAPNTSGVKTTDQARSLELCEAAAALAFDLLAEGGRFVCKILEGPEVTSFRRALAERFAAVRVQKPAASREESMETYVLGLGFGLPPGAETTPAPPARGRSRSPRRSRS